MWEAERGRKRREKGCAKGRMYPGAGKIFFTFWMLGGRTSYESKEMSEKGRREGLKFGKKEK